MGRVGSTSAADADTARERLRADLARFRQDPWLTGRLWWMSERPVWAVVTYRLAQMTLEANSAVRRLLNPMVNLVYPLIQALTGVELWPNTYVGGGLRIYHGDNIVINPNSRLGARCVLRQGVTIGVVRSGETACPVIGDDVEIGAYAQVLGGVTVGDGARIGALSVVLSDVPAHSTVVGIPARIVGRDEPSQPDTAG